MTRKSMSNYPSSERETGGSWTWPTENYGVFLPVGVQQDYDDRVASFWLPNTSVLLQVSSYLFSGVSRSASERMSDRIAMERIVNVKEISLHPETCDDWAAIGWHDNDGTYWEYIYAVYGHIAFFISLSYDSSEPTALTDWARRSVETLKVSETVRHLESGSG